MRAATYTKVSTADQNPELQLRELQDYAVRQGWDLTETYQDVINGTKSSRPGLNCLMADAKARKFDCLLVWKLDRFGRSLVDQYSGAGAVPDPIRRDDAEPGYRRKTPCPTLFAPRPGSRCGIRAIPDQGTDPGRADSLQADYLCGQQSWKDGLQPLREEPSTA
jgi:hypothetical protein